MDVQTDLLTFCYMQKIQKLVLIKWWPDNIDFHAMWAFW